ncbi:hypothetical protein VB002_05940 [Campylobacter concisus]
MPVPLLSDIAKDFGMSTADTGLIITIYAWSVTILSLPFMLLTANLERRSLLLKVFIIFVASHALCAVAWKFYCFSHSSRANSHLARHILVDHRLACC